MFVEGMLLKHDVLHHNRSSQIFMLQNFTWLWPGLDSNSYHAIFASYSECSVVPSATG